MNQGGARVGVVFGDFGHVLRKKEESRLDRCGGGGGSKAAGSRQCHVFFRVVPGSRESISVAFSIRCCYLGEMKHVNALTRVPREA